MALAALIVAVVAVTISLLSLAWTVGWSIYTHRRTTRPAVTVRGTWAFPVSDSGPGDEILIDVTATNTGLVPVELTSAKFEVRGVSENVVLLNSRLQTPSPLPIRLEAGGYWTGYAGVRELGETLARHLPHAASWKIRPVVYGLRESKLRAPRARDVDHAQT
jgi:hypothetical protein